MNGLQINPFRAGMSLAAIRGNPKLRRCALGIALLMPGSLFLLPLLYWAWRCWSIRLPAAARVHAARSSRASPG